MAISIRTGGPIWRCRLSSTGPPGVISILIQNPVSAQPTFEPPVNYGTAEGPIAARAADLNGDGKLDLAVLNTYAETISIFLASGAGKFGPAATYFAGSSPTGIALGDLDGDGSVDLAVSNSTLNRATILWGVGNGTFVGETDVPTGSSPSGVGLGDFNQDGRLDLATADNGSSTISLLLNLGSRRFATPSPFATAPEPTSITVAELTGDSVPDVIVTSWSRDVVAAHRGFANGTLGTPNIYDVGTNPSRAAVGDLDSDGIPDLAISNQNVVMGSLCTLRGHGDASFDRAQFRFGAERPTSIAVADLDGDGMRDLVIPNSGNLGYPITGMSVGILYGHGNLTFGSGLTQALSSQASVGGVAALGDVDHDGKLDLIVGSRPNLSAAAFLEAYPSAGDATFLLPPVTSTSVNGSPQLLRTADMNRDGALDVIIGASTTGISVQLGNGGGAFAAPIAGSAAFAVDDFVLGDVNRDGILDVVAGVTPSGTSHEVRVLLGTGTGALSLATTYAIEVNKGGLALGDLNRDGILDLVYTSSSFAGVSVRPGSGTGAFGAPLTAEAGRELWSTVLLDYNRDGMLDVAVYDQGDGVAGELAGVSVLPGLGNGNLGVHVKSDLTMPTGGSALAQWDLNADGYQDLVAIEGDQFQYRSMAACALLGNGAGGFGAHTLYGLGSSQTSPFLVGDLDRDGRADLVSAVDGGAVPTASSNSWIHVLRGDRPGYPGTFAAPLNSAAAGATAALALGDFDRDGKLDVAVCEPGSSPAGVMLGIGDGTMDSDVGYAASLFASATAVGDLNRDGILDLVTGSGGLPYGVSVSLGMAGGAFGAKTFYAGGGNVATDIEIADLNRDGKLDVVLSTGAGGGVVYLGQGNGALGAGAALSLGSYWAYDTGVADMNTDGIPDLVIATGEFATLLVLPGVGNGTFGALQAYSVGDEPYHLAVGDFNRDGKGDVVVDLAGMPGISVALGNGAFGFSAHLDTFLAHSAVGLAVGDVNGDGIPDVAAGLSGANLVTVLRGSGDGTFFSRLDYATGIGPQAVAIADMNRDGKPDVVTANGAGANVSVLLGAGTGVPTAVESVDDDQGSPGVGVARLAQNRPNPFNPRTVIGYSVGVAAAGAVGGGPAGGGAAVHVRLRVFDARGGLVATLVDRVEPAGQHEVAWLGRDDRGREVASGIYYYRLEAGRAVESKRMVLLK